MDGYQAKRPIHPYLNAIRALNTLRQVRRECGDAKFRKACHQLLDMIEYELRRPEGVAGIDESGRRPADYALAMMREAGDRYVAEHRVRMPRAARKRAARRKASMQTAA